MIIAVPEKTMLKPAEDLLLYSTLFILALAIIMLIIGWILSFQISHTIRRLEKDVQRLNNLDLTQTIQIPPIKDLRSLAGAIELMRQSLEQYQHLDNKLNYLDGNKGQNGNPDETA